MVRWKVKSDDDGRVKEAKEKKGKRLRDEHEWCDSDECDDSVKNVMTGCERSDRV